MCYRPRDRRPHRSYRRLQRALTTNWHPFDRGGRRQPWAWCHCARWSFEAIHRDCGQGRCLSHQTLKTIRYECPRVPTRAETGDSRFSSLRPPRNYVSSSVRPSSHAPPPASSHAPPPASSHFLSLVARSLCFRVMTSLIAFPSHSPYVWRLIRFELWLLPILQDMKNYEFLAQCFVFSLCGRLSCACKDLWDGNKMRRWVLRYANELLSSALPSYQNSLRIYNVVIVHDEIRFRERIVARIIESQHIQNRINDPWNPGGSRVRYKYTDTERRKILEIHDVS